MCSGRPAVTSACVLVAAMLTACTAARPPVSNGPDASGTTRLPFSEAVRRLEVGDRVRVQLHGEMVKGSVAWASEDELGLRVKDGERRVACSEIRWFQKVDSRGIGTGFAIGMLLALLPAYNSCDNVGCWTGGLGIFGALGAAVGAGISEEPPFFEASPGWCPTPKASRINRD